MTFQTQNTVDGHNFAPALRIPPSQPEENDAFFFPQTNKSADLSLISTKQLDNYVLHGRYKKNTRRRVFSFRVGDRVLSCSRIFSQTVVVAS